MQVCSHTGAQRGHAWRGHEITAVEMENRRSFGLKGSLRCPLTTSLSTTSTVKKRAPLAGGGLDQTCTQSVLLGGIF